MKFDAPLRDVPLGEVAEEVVVVVVLGEGHRVIDRPSGDRATRHRRGE